MTIHDVAVHQKGSARWAQPPARPVKDDESQIPYAKIMDSEDRSAFSTAVIKAVLEPIRGKFSPWPLPAAID